MSQLAFTVIGAVIGAYTPIGPVQGAMIGASLGGAMFPPRTTLPAVEGARIHDRAIQTSAYGGAIPVVYGTMRLAGNVIWQTDMVETATTTTTGG